MPENFFKAMKQQLVKLHPTLLKILQEKEMVVRVKEKDIFQVYWKKRVEKKFAETQIELESILEDYVLFQNSIGKEVFDYLSVSKDKDVKSLLNIFRMDVWFEKDVFSRFKFVDNKYYRFFKDDLQTEVFFENGEKEEEAKQAMINTCRIELIDSFQTKWNYIKNYLKKEKNKLDSKINEIRKSKNKPSEFFAYGLKTIKDNSTIAMIILGVSVECHIKLKHGNFLKESISLGQIMSELKKRKKMTKFLNLLNDLNNLYVKAKHEKDTLIPETEVELFYQKAIVFF